MGLTARFYADAEAIRIELRQHATREVRAAADGAPAMIVCSCGHVATADADDPANGAKALDRWTDHFLAALKGPTVP